MKRILPIILLVCSLSVAAQDYYKELFDELPNLTPHEALYRLTDYQAFYPQWHNTYYQLGRLSRELSATEHPLRDYGELSLCLYNAKLYFGNCIHYAKDQQLRTQYYEDVPHEGKKVTNEDLEQYLYQQMAEIEETTRQVEELYNAYYQLVNRYEDCRLLFSQFVEKYTSVKNAHLLLEQTDRDLLRQLQQLSDSLPDDIQRFQTALAAYPIQGYQPDVQWQPIDLYRLDGLTTTDFLQDNIALWDYATWVNRFVKLQNSVYQRFYDDINADYELSTQTIIGKNRRPYEPNEVLLNRIERLDYHSFMLPLLHAYQQTALTAYEARDIRQTTLADEDALAQALLRAYTLTPRRKLIQADNDSIKRFYSAEDAQKYEDFLSQYYPDKQPPTAEPCFAWYDSIVQQTADYLLEAVEKNFNENTTTYFNEFTKETLTPTYKDEVLTLTRRAANKKVLATLNIPLQGSLLALLPVDGNYLALINYTQIDDKQAAHEKDIAALLFTPEGEVVSAVYYGQDSPIELIAARKLTSNNIALIARENGKAKLLFIDNKGQRK